jgi:hypothetical protein
MDHAQPDQHANAMEIVFLQHQSVSASKGMENARPAVIIREEPDESYLECFHVACTVCWWCGHDVWWAWWENVITREPEGNTRSCTNGRVEDDEGYTFLMLLTLKNMCRAWKRRIWCQLGRVVLVMWSVDNTPKKVNLPCVLCTVTRIESGSHKNPVIYLTQKIKGYWYPVSEMCSC